MLRSVGLDVVSVRRIAGAIERYGDRFIKRVLGDEEIDLLAARCDRTVFIAGRFAAKEAFVKALGDFLTNRPPLRKLQIVNTKTGKPRVLLPETVQTRLGLAKLHLSISHEREFAAAVAILSEDL